MPSRARRRAQPATCNPVTCNDHTGAAGRIPTCIVPFRRRMPHVFGHDSNRTRNSEFGVQSKLNCTGIAVHSAFRVPHSAFEKLVSAAGLAPALPRFQAEHVAATPRAVCPRRSVGRRRGSCFRWKRNVSSLDGVPRRDSEIGGPEGSCTLNPPADNGALYRLSYESEMVHQAETCAKLVGSAGNAPVVASGLFEDTG